MTAPLRGKAVATVSARGLASDADLRALVQADQAAAARDVPAKLKIVRKRSGNR